MRSFVFVGAAMFLAGISTASLGPVLNELGETVNDAAPVERQVQGLDALNVLQPVMEEVEEVANLKRQVQGVVPQVEVPALNNVVGLKKVERQLEGVEIPNVGLPKVKKVGAPTKVKKVEGAHKVKRRTGVVAVPDAIDSGLPRLS